MATTTMTISREREELLSEYAEAATSLYGIIRIFDFVKVFNHYEEAATTTAEVTLALTRLANTDDVDYSISGDIISGFEFQPDFDDYDEIVMYISACQEGIPHYLPEKEEFLKYTDFSYREPEKPYADLKAYILKNKLTKKIDDVDDDLIDIQEMLRLGFEADAQIEYFTRRGYRFKNIDRANEFLQLVMNVHNNTRQYECNGFTPNEICDPIEYPKLTTLPARPNKTQTSTKIGRNAPCPCGSGLKYKKCCGK
jgi:hypothetical protein